MLINLFMQVSEFWFQAIKASLRGLNELFYDRSISNSLLIFLMYITWIISRGFTAFRISKGNFHCTYCISNLIQSNTNYYELFANYKYLLAYYRLKVVTGATRDQAMSRTSVAGFTVEKWSVWGDLCALGCRVLDSLIKLNGQSPRRYCLSSEVPVKSFHVRSYSKLDFPTGSTSRNEARVKSCI